MAKILIVDDEEKIRVMIRKYAEFEGFEVFEASHGLEAIAWVEKQDFDIVVLDIMMPELDGFSTCKSIREHSDVPVIMLSARSEEYDKIHGFGLGIDDYVVKPFSPKELMLRVNAILHRIHDTKVHDTVQYQDLVIDFTSRSVRIAKELVPMSPKEYDLLFYLAKNKGIALTREQILNKVWGYDFFGDDRTLDTHIKLLRRKMGPYSHLIITLRGVGYRFEVE